MKFYTPLLAAIAAAGFSAAGCVSSNTPDAVPPPVGSSATLSPADAANCRDGSIDIYFNQWEYELNSFSRDVLTRAQGSLAGCRIEHVRIVGLADATGDEQANIEVSQKRTQSIADALEAGGWSRSQFELVAVGKRGAVVDGVEAPMRRRANISVKASAP
jgi:outer membrane protein OmpA-like peptidoglycan-associated protein